MPISIWRSPGRPTRSSSIRPILLAGSRLCASRYMIGCNQFHQDRKQDREVRPGLDPPGESNRPVCDRQFARVTGYSGGSDEIRREGFGRRLRRSATSATFGPTVFENTRTRHEGDPQRKLSPWSAPSRSMTMTSTISASRANDTSTARRTAFWTHNGGAPHAASQPRSFRSRGSAFHRRV